MPAKQVKGAAGVMGWPVKHSLSPKLHGYWIDQYGFDTRYDLLPVEPENLENALHSLLVNGYTGCNLTLPHKTEALKHMSVISDTAKAIGAVNTVVVQSDGSLFGDNTDAYGFIQSLNTQCSGWQKTVTSALIIGAGGAAKAVLFGLKDAGIDNITVANRTIEKAKSLCDTAISISDIRDILPETDLIINTTSLGMAGQPPLDIDISALPKHAIVADIVYVPRKTDLLKQAEELGLKTAEGIDMLLHQAVPAFEHWFDIRPDVTDDLKDMILNEVAS
tara:strand:+ start:79 stop:909 length:831 start_codon:yes stop_codon:yes gene_type:complete